MFKCDRLMVYIEHTLQIMIYVMCQGTLLYCELKHLLMESRPGEKETSMEQF